MVLFKQAYLRYKLTNPGVNTHLSIALRRSISRKNGIHFQKIIPNFRYEAQDMRNEALASAGESHSYRHFSQPVYTKVALWTQIAQKEEGAENRTMLIIFKLSFNEMTKKT